MVWLHRGDCSCAADDRLFIDILLPLGTLARPLMIQLCKPCVNSDEIGSVSGESNCLCPGSMTGVSSSR